MAAGAALTGRRLRRDQRGATIVEFAVIAPVLFGFLMFLIDTGYFIFARAVLSGEVNAAGRNSTLGSATDAARAELDTRVGDQVKRLVPHGQLAFERTAFANYRFAQAQAEPFNDSNGNNICDNGETYVDLNGNGSHDLNGGRAGGGSAKDVVIYTVTLRYDRLLPMHKLLGWDQEVAMTSTTVLRNQPFDNQTQPSSRNCI